MRFNYVVIVVVLIGSALLGRMAMRPGPLPAFQADLARCLDAFWETKGCDVQVRGTVDQAEVSASVPFPNGTTPRQEDWMQDFVRFVARRHPGVKVGSVRVSASGYAADVAAPPGYEDVTRVETLQQQLQGQLDRQWGEGRALILLAPGPPLASHSSEARAPAPVTSKRAPAAPGFTGEKALPVQERANSIAPAPGPAPQTSAPTAVLVVQSEALAAQAASLVQPSTSGLRVVVLP